jgi:hypothetical protein
MKKLSLIFVYIISIFSLQTSFSQGFYYGVHAGFNGSSIIETTNWGGRIEKNMKFGIQGGVTAEYEILSFLSVSTAVSFFQKGDKIKDHFATSRATLGYIDIPINVNYKMPFGNVKFGASFGPYTSIAIAGNRSFVTPEEVEPDFEWHFEEHGHEAYYYDDSPFYGDEWNSYRRFDSGICAGVKFEYRQYAVNITYARGFVDIKSDEAVKARNSVLGLSVTYFLNKKFL